MKHKHPYIAIEVENRKLTPFLELPAEQKVRSMPLTTMVDNQKRAIVRLLLILPEKQIPLKEFDLKHLKPGPAGPPRFVLDCRWDGKTVLTVSLKVDGSIYSEEKLRLGTYLRKKRGYIIPLVLLLAVVTGATLFLVLPGNFWTRAQRSTETATDRSPAQTGKRATGQQAAPSIPTRQPDPQTPAQTPAPSAPTQQATPRAPAQTPAPPASTQQATPRAPAQTPAPPASTRQPDPQAPAQTPAPSASSRQPAQQTPAAEPAASEAAQKSVPQAPAQVPTDSPASPAAAEAREPELVSVSRNLVLYFDPNDTRLTQEARRNLENLSREISEWKSLSFTFEGHCALFGSEEGRIELSRDRARNSAAYVSQLTGIDEAQFSISWFAGEQPVSSAQEQQELNRRVEISVRGEAEAP